MTETNELKRVFLCGCGGGYDIYGSIPYYLKLKSSGNVDITLINYSFTQRNLLSQFGQELTTGFFRVDPKKDLSLTEEIYFPEQRLANELEVPIYTILCDYNRTTIESIIEAYKYLIQDRIIDELLLIDCGSDVLLTGNEDGLGTPLEDMSHARAVHYLSSDQVKAKYIAVIGTNIDTGHGVLQSDIDARLTALSPLAVFKWLWESEDDIIRRYVDIVFRCNPQHTIVHSLVCAALEGQRGYYLPDHLRGRLHKSIVQLTEDTCLSTGYYFDDVMHDNIYFDRLTPQMNLTEVHQTIYSSKVKFVNIDKTVSSQRSTSSARKSRLSSLFSCVSSTKNRSSSSQKEDQQ